MQEEATAPTERDIAETRDTIQRQLAEAQETVASGSHDAYVSDVDATDNGELVLTIGVGKEHNCHTASVPVIDETADDGLTDEARKLQQRTNTDVRQPDGLIGAPVTLIYRGGTPIAVFETDWEERLRENNIVELCSDGGYDITLRSLFGSVLVSFLLGVLLVSGLPQALAAFVLMLCVLFSPIVAVVLMLLTYSPAAYSCR